MPQAVSDRIRVAYAEEVTYGVNPGGTFKEVRLTGEGLERTQASTRSAEIRSDRQTTDIVRTRIGAGGPLNGELSYGAYDDWLQAAIMSAAWTSLGTLGPVSTISAASGDNSYNDSGNGFTVGTGFGVGKWIKATGFTNAANNGFKKIVSRTDAKIVVSGGTLVTESAAAGRTVNVLGEIVNGTLFKTYAIEKKFADLTSEYELNLGMGIDTFSLDTRTEQIITCSFGFLGSSSASAAADAGTGYTAAPTAAVMSSVDDVTAVLDGQVADAAVQSLTMALANNLRQRIVVGVLGAISVGVGKINLTGTYQRFFETKALMDKFVNFTNSSLAVIYEDAAGNTYIVDTPRIKYTSGRRVAGGENQDIVADLAWEAIMDPTELKTIRIARYTGP